jgi:hypothetical protein
MPVVLRGLTSSRVSTIDDISYPKTFLCFFNYRNFEGVEAPEGCENVA